MTPSKESHHIIFHLKIPTLIYFYKTLDQKYVQELKNLALYYKDYFILTLVDVNLKGKYTRKLVDYLGVKEGPALRILNLEDHVKRYKFIGKLDFELTEFFI